MPAWDVRRKWTEHDKTKYREFVTRQAANFVKMGTKFTCEDLALRLLVDFAADRYLPITIVNGAYTNTTRTVSTSRTRPYSKTTMAEFVVGTSRSGTRNVQRLRK